MSFLQSFLMSSFGPITVTWLLMHKLTFQVSFTCILIWKMCASRKNCKVIVLLHIFYLLTQYCPEITEPVKTHHTEGDAEPNVVHQQHVCQFQSCFQILLSTSLIDFFPPFWKLWTGSQDLFSKRQGGIVCSCRSSCI